MGEWFFLRLAGVSRGTHWYLREWGGFEYVFQKA